MNIVEVLISLVAPHVCLGCGVEGSTLCSGCGETELHKPPSRCYRCHAVTSQYQLCAPCKRKIGLSHMWIAAGYEGLAKEVVHKLKYERAQASGRDIARVLDKITPLLPPNTIVIHVPTVNARIRQRGYDQAQVIAKEFARLRGYEYRSALIRNTKTSQVGSGRADRFAHLKNAFSLKRPKQLKDQRILLIDDVLTTGATLESAARTMRSARVKSVDALVFAHSFES